MWQRQFFNNSCSITMIGWPGSILLVVAAACGFPAPADLPGPDGDLPADAPISDSTELPPPPGATVQVSATGDDGNDGMASPVRTLKRAIGIAAASTQITHIVLASGRYSLASGENFPYTVPANVTVTGPAGGGAILVGSKAEPGLIVETGTLRDLELEDFMVGIVVTGMTRVANVRIRSSALAVRAETAAKLVADNLDIAGTPAACATGIVLNGAADLKSTRLATRGLAVSLEVKDRSVMSVMSATISGNPNCMSNGAPALYAISANSTGALEVGDSLIDGGSNGIRLGNGPATILNTTLRNMRSTAIAGGLGELRMMGGEISAIGGAGLDGGGADATFIDVTIKSSVYFAGLGGRKLTMRGCTVTATIQLDYDSNADLGTASSPGSNTIRPNLGIGLDVNTQLGPSIDAVGNIWKPTQGANEQGRYSLGTVMLGPIDGSPGNNVSISRARTVNL